MKSNILHQPGSPNDPRAFEAALAANLRAHRERLGWTQADLAQRSGVSKGMLLQVEQARTNPSIATICKLANALGVAVPRLLDARAEPVVRVATAREVTWLWRGRTGSAAGLVAGVDQPVPVELWTWTIAPGDGYDAVAHPPGTRELIQAIEGSVSVTVDGAEVTAGPGECVVFLADRPHRYAAAGRRRVRFLMVVIEPLQVTPWPVGPRHRPISPAAEAPPEPRRPARGTARRAPAARPR
jgi:transcriptional regulator with XRE-family HTH domain/mannose-6-phosphate isomerase-like protein (cupin superfamily)